MSSALPPGFGPATAAWFRAAFPAPTPVQARGWAHILAGEHALLLAPTGSGKTLAAFLVALDRLSAPRPADAPAGVRVLYVSPLKALVHDVERNLRAPLAGIAAAAAAHGLPWHPARVALRTGDTPARERRSFPRDPPDILVTTPESLFLLLSSSAREALRTVECVIVDEIHAVAATKRGAHLALSLERLSALAHHDPQRIGLSATQRPLSVVAGFLGGDRPVAIVDASALPRLDLGVVVPLPDLEAPPAGAPPPAVPSPAAVSISPGDRQGVWLAIHPAIFALVRAHRTTIVFANSRRLCERIALRLNELAAEAGLAPLARAHHGSVSHDQRREIEEALKGGLLPCIVATSSLELGIDMGAVDLVIQVGSPGAVSAGLQRVGRAGHAVGETSRGRIFPRHRGEVLEAAVVAARMRRAEVEALQPPRAPLDVLAQQVVAMGFEREWPVGALHAVLRRAGPYTTLSEDTLRAVLDMLAGRLDAPATEAEALRELRPRIRWDRGEDVIVARRDAFPVLMANAGTIPDRGLYPVFVAPEGPRVGELDEEMVHESRKGDVFLLGASAWRVVELRADRVLVAPAPGEPGRMPFWRGEGPGRPPDIGEAMGALIRELGQRGDAGADYLCGELGLDEFAAANLVALVAEQRAATGVLPTDTQIVVERFRDELGDWRVCVLSARGARVHAPWAMALSATLEERLGAPVQALWTDDGIVLRVPDLELPPPVDALFPAPEEIEDRVLAQLGGSSLFAARFREAAGRALLLPKRRPGQRAPLWVQRMRAQSLLAAVKDDGAHPLVLEVVRECLQDVFDLPGLRALLGAVRDRRVRVSEVETPAASPLARGLVFSFVGNWLYEGDAPLAERRLQALTVDRALLRELLGSDEAAGFLDPDAVAAVEAELQYTAESRRASGPDTLHDVLRALGDLTEAEIAARAAGDPAPWLAALQGTRRAARARIGGEERWVALEDAARFRDGLGVVPPAGVPVALLGPVANALEALVERWARTHGPFAPAELAARWALPVGAIEGVLRVLAGRGRLVPAPVESASPCWVDPDVLRRIQRRIVARLRGEVEPVDASAYARFALAWQGVGAPPGGPARLVEALSRLEALPLPWSDWESAILPARVAGYQPAWLDELCAGGGLVWVGAGALGPSDGRVLLVRRSEIGLLVDPPGEAPGDAVHAAILSALGARGACFVSELHLAVEAAVGRTPLAAVEEAIWDLVWKGFLSNDSLHPLRSLGGPRRAAEPPRATPLAGGWGWGRSVKATGGRWFRLDALHGPPPAPTAVAHARAALLLERHGLLNREIAAGETQAFGPLVPVLHALEDAGRARRGWFVAGLSASTWGHAGAVDRLRALRFPPEVPDARVLAATDPAVVWGAAVDWPAHGEGGAGARRLAGSRVVLVDGDPVLLLARGARALTTFPAAGEPRRLRAAVDALLRRLREEGARSTTLLKVDGGPARQSARADALLAAGLRADGEGLRLELPL